MIYFPPVTPVDLRARFIVFAVSFLKSAGPLRSETLKVIFGS